MWRGVLVGENSSASHAIVSGSPPVRPAAVSVKGKWGYVDGGGKTVIEPNFDEAGGFTDGIARVTRDGKSGWIDKSGKYVWTLSK